jgi:hypothetical protein
MDAKTNFKARLPRRHLTEGPARVPHRSRGCAVERNSFDVAAVFKKTLYSADSKRGGRYVAKELSQVSGIPLLTTAPLDHGSPHGGRIIVTEQTLANLKYHAVTHPGGQAEKISHADA